VKRTALKRKTPLKRGRKKVYGNADLWRSFKQEVLARDGGCVLRNQDEHECEGDVQACHVVPKQRLKRYGFDAQVIYDPRSAIAGCEKAHRRNDRAFDRFPIEFLPREVHDFYEELGLRFALERIYPRPADALSPNKEKDQSRC
jgi:hypothetical protein